MKALGQACHYSWGEYPHQWQQTFEASKTLEKPNNQGTEAGD